MRRFELGDRFWGVNYKGTDLLILSGKVGSSGKTQIKKFKKLEEAEAHAEELVAAKVKEGYEELGAEGAPAAAPAKAAKAPQKKAAAVEEVEEDEAPAPKAAKKEPAKAAATASFLERVLPDPDAIDPPPAPAEPEPPPSEKKCLEEMAKHFVEKTWNQYTHLSELKDGIKKSKGRNKELMEEILATYAVGVAPKSLDVEASAAALHLVPEEWIFPYLYARAGVAHVVEAVLKAASFRKSSTGGQGGSWVSLESHEPKLSDWVPFSNTVSKDGSGALRPRLEKATKKDADAARALATKARGEPLPLRILLSVAFVDREWMAEDTREVLALKKDEYSYSLPRTLFSVLRDPDLVTQLAKRHADDVPGDALLDDLGLVAAPAVILAYEKDPKNDYRAKTLTRVETFAAAKALVDGLSNKRANEVIRPYFERRPDLAIAALAPVVARGDKIAPFCKPVLEAAIRNNPAVAAKVIPTLDAKSQALLAESNKPKAPEVAAKNVPKVLASAPDVKKKKPLPPFVDVASLPRLELPEGTGALPETSSAHLLAMLQASELKAAHPAIADVKKACSAESLAAFAWGLFEAWLASGVGSKENWAFTALGLLGDDEAARRLTPMIRAWPGESQHARAGVGLDVLAGIGTDLALMNLNGVAEKVKFKALQQKAREKVAEIAAARGLTPEELGDRLVPDLGLDDDGSMTLDFGERAFKVAFDEALKPVLKDPSGKVIGDLPKPGKSDDAAKAGEATERFKLLKKDARAIASLQITRLELSMCNQRRWKADDWKTLILDHPLLVHLARRLVWGVFDKAKLKASFRVAEDKTFADEADEAFKLSKDMTIGLAHRLEMPDSLLAKWGTVFADYKILQPFDQLGRQVYAPTDAEKKAGQSSRMNKVSVKTGKVMGLENRGWRKGEPQDAGWVWDMLKTLPGGYEASFAIGGGICMGAPDMNPSQQELSGIAITKKDGGKATFGDLSPTAFSELMRDFEGLRE